MIDHHRAAYTRPTNELPQSAARAKLMRETTNASLPTAALILQKDDVVNVMVSGEVTDATREQQLNILEKMLAGLHDVVERERAAVIGAMAPAE